MKRKSLLALLLAIVLVLGTACGNEGAYISQTPQKQNISIEATDKEQKVEATTEKQTQEDSSVMVWIPKTGKRYHSNSKCSGMKNPSKVPIDKAVRLGYTPCQNCY